MKHFTKLLAALTLFATGAVHAELIGTPVTTLEVGKTYVFQNTRAARATSNCEYLYLSDKNLGEPLECNETISANCIWMVEPGSVDGAFAIKMKLPVATSFVMSV